jgi:DNA-binding HxlR family transcriptional regulator
LISCSWLHLLKVWSLLKSRGDSVEVLRACSWLVPKKTKDLMALIPDISERTAREWLKELKTAESLIRNTIRESADLKDEC